MTLDMQEIRAVLIRAGARQPDSSFQVWDLREPGWLDRLRGTGSRVDHAKRALLAAFVAGREALFLAPPLPLDCDEDPAGWSSHADGLWRAPGDLDVTSFLESSIALQGNWQIFYGAAPPSTSMDFVRAQPQEVDIFLHDQRLAGVIDSFHDDLYWRIAVRTEGAV